MYEIRVKQQILNEFEKFITYLKHLGYKGFSIENFNEEISLESLKDVRRKVEEEKLDMATRVDITPRSKREVIRLARKYRRKYDIIVSHPLSLEAARYSAEDPRIDILSFDKTPQFFDYKEAHVMKRRNKILEIALKEFIKKDQLLRSFKILNKMVSIAVLVGVQVIITSGAENYYELKTPEDLKNAIHFFLDRKIIKKLKIADIDKIILMNRKKRLGIIPVRGVEVIKSGKNET